MFKTLFATILLSTSISTPTLKADVIQPRKANNNLNYLYGAYNYKDDIDLFDLWSTYGADSQSYVFETPTENQTHFNLVPFCFNDSSKNYDLYLSAINFVLSSGTFAPYLRVEYVLYDTYGTDRSYNFIIDGEDSDFTTFDYPDVIFNVLQSSYIGGDSYDFFYAVFTKENNAHTTTYSGYYNFSNSGSLTPGKIFVCGSCNFNNGLWMGFSNYDVNNYNHALRFYCYNSDSDTYSSLVYQYPFTSNEVVVADNILISNGKMSITCYNYLSTIGVFSYVRDSTYDNATFNDLLFSVMDSPIYFITRLLSFEFFGVNLFVATTGLLTLCVILILIRKFF